MDDGGGKQGGDPDDVAHYVATMSADLSAMARRHGLETLGYLLDMARLEAESMARHDGRRRKEH